MLFDRKSMDFLRELMETASPSGYEMEAAKCFAAYLQNCCQVRHDVLGNTIAVLNENAPMRVLLDAHYDEIGFQIVYIGDDGLIYFRANGGIDKLNIPSSEVDILTPNGKVPGVIGKKPIQLVERGLHIIVYDHVTQTIADTVAFDALSGFTAVR